MCKKCTIISLVSETNTFFLRLCSNVVRTILKEANVPYENMSLINLPIVIAPAELSATHYMAQLSMK